MSKEKTPVIIVKPSDLPLHCPLPGAELWQLHPRVYLPIKEKNEVTCPYCEAKYLLELS